MCAASAVPSRGDRRMIVKALLIEATISRASTRFSSCKSRISRRNRATPSSIGRPSLRLQAPTICDTENLEFSSVICRMASNSCGALGLRSGLRPRRSSGLRSSSSMALITSLSIMVTLFVVRVDGATGRLPYRSVHAACAHRAARVPAPAPGKQHPRRDGSCRGRG